MAKHYCFFWCANGIERILSKMYNRRGVGTVLVRYACRVEGEAVTHDAPHVEAPLICVSLLGCRAGAVLAVADVMAKAPGFADDCRTALGLYDEAAACGAALRLQLTFSIRDASAEELGPFRKAGYGTTGLVLLEDGERVGWTFYSVAPDGSVIGHDTKVWSGNSRAFAYLMRKSRAHLKRCGVDEVWIWDAGGEDPKVMAMFRKLGAEAVFTVYRLPLE